MEETEHRPDSDSDEINLYALFQVIWKRKSLIIAIFLIAVIAAAVISYMLPPVYRVTAVVSPGWITADSAGKATYVDSALNIKSLIENGAFNELIITSLKLEHDKFSQMKFNIKLANNTEALYISYDTKDPSLGKKIVGELLKLINEYYENRTESGRMTIDNTINMLKDKMEVLKATEKNLAAQLKGVDENTKVIMRERNEMLKKGEKADSVALLLYSNTIQQNIAYINSLQASLQGNRLDQESTKEKILNMGLDKLKIEGFKIIQDPFSSTRPVAPKKKNNVAIAGITSLFFGIFLVFFLEFLKKAKANNRS